MTAIALTPLAPIANKESFIERFGDWISGLFHHLENAYNELEDVAKKAAVWGSGLIAIVNNMLNALPADVIAMIKVKFPDLSLDVVHGFLDTLRVKIGDIASAIPLTLEEAIKWLQGFLLKHVDDHSAWGIISSYLGNLLSILFSPQTAIEKFISIAVWVYHQIVRPHVAIA